MPVQESLPARQLRRRFSRHEIEGMVARDDIAAMRAVCALFRQQTLDERADKVTKYKNHRGFSAVHATVGTELATWMTGGKMDGVMRRRTGGGRVFGIWEDSGRPKIVSRIEICRTLALHYAGQLTKIANKEL